MPSNEQSREFDYNLKNLSIVTHSGDRVNISSVFQSMSIFQSIFMNHMQGEIEVDESIGMLEVLPIMGGEDLEVQFEVTHSSSNEFKRTFKIYKVDNVEDHENITRRSYMIYFASPQMFHNLNISMSRSFDKLRGCEIVQNIAENNLNVENIEVERCRDKMNFIIPNWKPFKAIDFIVRNSISNKSGAADFVFFEAKDKFVFKTLTRLKEQEVSEYYSYGPSNNEVEKIDSSQIYNFNIEEIWDQIENMRNGVFGNKIFTHNIETKQYKEHDFTYEEDDSSLNRKPLNDELETSVWNDVGFYPKTVDGFYRNIEEWKQKRRHQLEKMENFKLKVSIPGDPGRDVGNVANVTFPSINTDETKVKDSVLSGNYLIVDLRHFMTNDKYQQQLTLQKDSYDKRFRR